MVVLFFNRVIDPRYTISLRSYISTWRENVFSAAVVFQIDLLTFEKIGY